MKEFLTITAAFVVFALSHSILAADSVKAKLLSVLGERAYMYRFLYSVLSLVLIAVIYWQFPPDGQVLYRVASPWRWLMLAIQAIMGVLFIKTVIDFQGSDFLGYRSLRTRAATPEEHLNIEGLFRFVRHPLYVIATIYLLAAPDMTVGRLAWTTNIILYFWIGTFFEERRLVAQFGDAYREYQQRVPRFIPRLRRRRKQHSQA